MSRRAQIALVLGLLLLCACLTVLGGGVAGLLVWNAGQQVPVVAVPTAQPWPSPTPVPPTRTPVPPTPTLPPPTETPTPALELLDTVGRLHAAELPQRDIRLLAERLRSQGPIPRVVREAPPDYQIGDVERFWIGNLDTLQHHRVAAVLRYITPHLYVWVEDGVNYDWAGLVRSADQFERHTYPTTRAFFGSEWSPGVDADPRLHVLHSSGRRMGTSVAGYYSSADEYSQLANPYSNEREMFYISLSGLVSGTDLYDGVLAHEFQHMIHWAKDRNEDTWVNEGCSELSAHLNGYDPGGFEWAYIADPDVQLTNWPSEGSSAANYGASYLFMLYFLGRFGSEATQAVVAQADNGTAGFDRVLAAYDLAFDDVFADWLVANYLDNLAMVDGSVGRAYSYPEAVVGPVSVDASHTFYPVERESTVHQYGADYVRLTGVGDLSIEFEGESTVRLAPTDAYSGQYAWWSNRGDDSDATLTRAFDLTEVESATLQARMWYDIEGDWDYAYVEVSASGGRTWDLLSGSRTTTSNPNGNSFGPGYTGQSGGWIEERFDLSPYAGDNVLVRFEYVTDDAVHRSGWLIDDVRIPELNYADDMESGPGGWEANGFVYSDNRVPQGYLVRLLTVGQTVSVHTLAVDESGYGRAEIRGLGTGINTAVLVVAAVAPATTETAPYRYSIQELR